MFKLYNFHELIETSYGYRVNKIINSFYFNLGLENLIQDYNILFQESDAKKDFISYATETAPNIDINVLTEQLKNFMDQDHGCEYYISPVAVTHETCFVFKNLNVRKSYNFNFTTQDLIECNIRYFLCDRTFKGDNWSLMGDDIMNLFKKLNFECEVFGSPFNTRLKYFGSIFKQDSVFGSIGDRFDILNQLLNTGELRYKNQVIIKKTDIIKLTINPPSSHQLALNTADKLIELMKTRKCIYFFSLLALIYANQLKKNFMV